MWRRSGIAVLCYLLAAGVVTGAVVCELERADAYTAAAPAPTATATAHRHSEPDTRPHPTGDPGRRAGPRRRGDGVQRQPRRDPRAA